MTCRTARATLQQLACRRRGSLTAAKARDRWSLVSTADRSNLERACPGYLNTDPKSDDVFAESDAAIAEYVVAPEGVVAKMPAGLSLSRPRPFLLPPTRPLSACEPASWRRDRAF
jgi:hypothetical protein